MAEEGEESQNKRDSEEVETETFPRAQSDLTDGEKTWL